MLFIARTRIVERSFQGQVPRGVFGLFARWEDSRWRRAQCSSILVSSQTGDSALTFFPAIPMRQLFHVTLWFSPLVSLARYLQARCERARHRSA